MDLVKNSVIWLSGRKTYILCILTIIGFWAAYFQGAATLQDTINATIAAAGGMTMRAAVAKSGPNPPQS